MFVDGKWQDFADDPQGEIVLDRAPSPRFNRIRDLHKRHARPSPIIGLTAETRNEILEVILAIESGEAHYPEKEARKEDLGILWGKVAHLNAKLGLKYPETGKRYGNLEWPGELKPVIQINAAHPCGEHLDC